MTTRKSQSADTLTNTSGEVNVKELLEQIEKLKNQVESLQQNNTVEKTKTEYEEDEIDNIDINPSSYIRIISLIPWPLNLTTRPMGKGKIFRFNSFGSTKRILYSDLVDVLEVFSHFLDKGYFYIADKRVIRKHGLDSIYEKILSKDNIEKIISGVDSETALSLFKSATLDQQETIAKMLIDKRLVDESVDLNLWDKMKRELVNNKSFNMDDKYANAREYLDVLKDISEKEKKEE